MHSLTIWLIERIRHALHVAVVTFFVLCFVTFTTRTGEDWFAVTRGAVTGLLFGLVFAFGSRWADIEERG